VTPYVSATNVRAGGPQDPRFAALDERLILHPNPRAPATSAQGPLVVSPDATLGGFVRPDPDRFTRATAASWDPALDTAPVCFTRSPPWYKIDNVGSNWRAKTLSVGSLTEDFTDAAKAVARYAELERTYAGQAQLAIVLVGADSIETIRRTHGRTSTVRPTRRRRRTSPASDRAGSQPSPPRSPRGCPHRIDAFSVPNRVSVRS